MEPTRKRNKRKLEPDEAEADDRKMPPSIGGDFLVGSIAQRMIAPRISATNETSVRRQQLPEASYSSIAIAPASRSPRYYPAGQLGEEMRELERRFLGESDDDNTISETTHRQSSDQAERGLPRSPVPAEATELLSPAAYLTGSRQDLNEMMPYDSRYQHLRSLPQILGQPSIDSALLQSHGNLGSALGATDVGFLSRYAQHQSSLRTFQNIHQPSVASMPTPSQELPHARAPIQHTAEDAIDNDGRGYVVPLTASTDESALTAYQTLIRKSLEYFTAVEEDITTTVQGRRQKIMPNQVGIRCKHCSHLPITCRARAAVYFPKTLSSLYQGAQNIATAHFPECTELPTELVQRMVEERGRRGMDKAGRPYWSRMCQSVGIYEADGLLRMISPSNTVQAWPFR